MPPVIELDGTALLTAHNMPPRRTSQRLKLEEALAIFRRWGYEKNGSKPFDRYEHWVQKYPHWDKLTDAVVEFLESKDGQIWKNPELELVEEAMLADVKYVKFFRSISETDLSRLIRKLYPINLLRSHLVARIRSIPSDDLKSELYQYVLMNDPNSCIREDTFVLLAKMNWAGTQEHALALWKEDFCVTKIRALEGLAAIVSAYYPPFLSEALQSGDESLQKMAKHLSRHFEEDSQPCGRATCIKCFPQTT